MTTPWVAISLLLILLAGCNKGQPFSGDDGLVSYRFPLQVHKRDDVPVDRLKLLDRINRRLPIRFETVTDAVLDDHLANYTRRTSRAIDGGEARRLLDVIAQDVDKFDLHTIKVSTEAKLEAERSPLSYNRTALSVGDLLGAQLLQSYSGTVLTQLLARRTLGRQPYFARHPVVIFEAGHVLSGYLVPQSNDWILVGIEPSVRGRAEILYGPVSRLPPTLKIRFVKADYFFVSELFKPYLKNLLEVTNQMIRETANECGLPENRIAFVEAADLPGPSDRLDPNKFDWSPFAFEPDATPAGTRPRILEDRPVRRENIRGPFPDLNLYAYVPGSP